MGRPSFVAGFSLGGMAAWKLAQDRPDLLTGVFMEEPIVFTEKIYSGPLPEMLRGTVEQSEEWITRRTTRRCRGRRADPPGHPDAPGGHGGAPRSSGARRT
ncbi:MAG TPA: hypothetical protein VNO31_48540 [Umezawaea sp.]|nr:hypothetical protein [Umezawaea sp.]